MDSTLVHLLAGGVGGTAGAIVTCPLEVVKTRLQSSVANFSVQHVYVSSVACVQRQQVLQLSACHNVSHQFREAAINSSRKTRGSNIGLFHCLKYILQTEGPPALFKGLGPTLVGVAPSRAIYFYSYAQAKAMCNDSFVTPDSPLVHIISASFAGFSACTATNPIWLIKTRLQLDQRLGSDYTVRQCVQNVYREHGLRGFYKGITASYFGISETVIHFVIYEAVKSRLLEYSHQDNTTGERRLSDFFRFMCAGALSKTIASTIAYPHEVARTRLREEGNRYRTFFQTLCTVCREEGYRGMYRGLVTQLVRQIPNTAIMMSTYEAVVYLLSSNCDDDDEQDLAPVWQPSRA